MYLLIPVFCAIACHSGAYLHSNMYLLILSVRDIVAVGAPHLHSNMYLLIPVIAVREALYRVNLHSNMYLLILRPKVFLVDEIYKFTFQHVSINSDASTLHPLHSEDIYIPTCIY